MSRYTTALGLAITALKKHRLRTALSVTGTAIGIAAIVVILSAGESLRKNFEEQLAMFGTDWIQVEVKIPNTKQQSTSNASGMAQGISITTLSLDDKKKIDSLPNVKASYAAVLGQSVAQSLYAEKQTTYMAVSYEYPTIDATGTGSGRFFTQEEEEGLAKVIVLGTGIAKKLFPNQDPIGQTVKMEKVNLRVIGIMKEKGSTGFMSMDDWAFVPLHTAQKLLLGYDHLQMILVKMTDSSIDRLTAAEMEGVIRENHDISDPAKDDFAVTTQQQGMDMVDTIFNGITIVLTIIASVALLVGGVGIMNIMYVAVSERVFEIGLRKAVGATPRAIRTQFLTEAVVVTIVGGVVGIILAIILILVIYLLALANGFSWPLALSEQSLVIAIVFSSVVGIIFGYYPAQRAAALQPVVALTQRGS